MLSLLKIKNLAIVDELEVEFAPGLNVLTGETGAGKSIILKAIELLSGKRASTEIIRQGADKAEIEALFHLSKPLQQHLQSLFGEEVTFADDELIIKRTLDTAGKGKISINGSLANVSSLQKLSLHIIDITGQHQQQKLLEPSYHLELLDNFGVPEKLRQNVRELYKVFSEAASQLESFKTEASSKKDYFERLDAERKELKELALQEGEKEEIEVKLKVLANVETLGGLVSECIKNIEDDESGIDTALRNTTLLLQKATQLDTTLKSVSDMLETAYVQIEEGRRELDSYLAGLEADPETLEQLRERQSDLARVERKYQKDIPALIAYLSKIESELSFYESGEFDIEKLEQKVAAARAELTKAEELLTRKRKTVALELSKLVEEELDSLNMKRAKFTVDIAVAPSGPNGADAVTFLLAANVGEGFNPLNKVASGGELSRVCLILKTILNEKTGATLQVFDEIDSGVSGAISQTLGEKLKDLSKKSQVILVTHSPQIAALGNTHYVIEKSVVAERTKVSVKELSKLERIDHIASMLGGKKASAKFVESAKELLR